MPRIRAGVRVGVRRSARLLRRIAAGAALLALLPRPASPQSGAPQRPVTLRDVMRAAAERNPLVEAARARVQTARGARATAGVLPNPIVTYQVENAAFPGRSESIGMTREMSSYATLPLEPIWQRGPRTRRADENVLAAEADLTMTKHQVAADAARAFFRAALARMTEAAAADIEEGLDSLVRYSRVRVAEGAAAEGDLIRLQVERDRAATDRVLQQVEVVRARAALLPFLVDPGNSQRSPDLVVIVDDSLLGANAALPSHDQFAARALGRPDILAARARARAAGAETALQRTLLIRQLGAVIGTRSTGGIYSMIAGVSVPFPIFDQNRGEIQRATGERLAADRELAWVERRASAEVDAAYESARLLTTQVAALDGQFLSRANEARRIAIAAYQEGAVPLLQVIDATRTLADARVTYYRALFARQGSLLDLYTSAGLDPLSALTMSLPSPDSDGINGNPHAPTGKN